MPLSFAHFPVCYVGSKHSIQRTRSVYTFIHHVVIIVHPRHLSCSPSLQLLSRNRPHCGSFQGYFFSSSFVSSFDFLLKTLDIQLPLASF